MREFLSSLPNETAMAATKLILTGVLEEDPDVRIVESHCGGSLASNDRIDRGKALRKCFCPTSEYCAVLYDTAAARAGAGLGACYVWQ